jgi:hypothetical protein
LKKGKYSLLFNSLKILIFPISPLQIIEHASSTEAMSNILAAALLNKNEKYLFLFNRLAILSFSEVKIYEAY